MNTHYNYISLYILKKSVTLKSKLLQVKNNLKKNFCFLSYSNTLTDVKKIKLFKFY